jgi:hypothetical protein
MYYLNILHMDESELVRRVFTAQKLSSCKSDWILQVNDDLNECNIKLSETEIMKMKKFFFRKLVRKKVREASENYLVSLKKSKSSNIFPADDMKVYLKTNLLSTEEKAKFAHCAKNHGPAQPMAI